MANLHRSTAPPHYSSFRIVTGKEVFRPPRPAVTVHVLFARTDVVARYPLSIEACSEFTVHNALAVTSSDVLSL